MEYANFKFTEYKTVSEDEGRFTALGAVIGNIDLGDDLIEAGAFKKTLQENNKFPLLWQHDRNNVIGSVLGKETKDGVELDGSFNFEMIKNTNTPAVPFAHTAHALLKREDIKGFSMGYRAVKSFLKTTNDKVIRVLKEVKLHEFSVVTFPMNQLAILQSIKSKDDIFEAIIRYKEDKEFLDRLFTLLEVEPEKSTQILQEPKESLDYKRILNKLKEV